VPVSILEYVHCRCPIRASSRPVGLDLTTVTLLRAGRLAPESAPCIILAGLDQKGHAMKLWFEKFFNDEHGTIAIEYDLSAAGIAVAIIAVVPGVGSGLNTTFTSVSTALK
jgi:pilus assembly protein Flp/PilA